MDGGNLMRLAQVRLRNLSKTEETTMLLPLYHRFQEEIEQFTEKAQRKQTPGLGEISIWVRTKLTDKTFGEVLKERSQRAQLS